MSYIENQMSQWALLRVSVNEVCDIIPSRPQTLLLIHHVPVNNLLYFWHDL